MLAEARHDRLDQGDEIGKNMSGDGPVKCRPRRAAQIVMSTGRIVQPVGIGLGQTSTFCSSAPLSLLAI